MVFGNGVVVLVGDFCLARALETVAMTGSLAMVQSLATTVTEMAEGEVAQLERAGNPDATVEDYFRVIDRKTASLIAWCARCGGLGRRRARRAPLERYGRALGRAFQIADDVLDSAIDETTAGKSVGHDLQEGKLTLPVLLACEADPELGRRIRKLLGEHGVPAAVAAEILADVRAAGGVDRARRKAAALADEAVRALDALPPSPLPGRAAGARPPVGGPELLMSQRGGGDARDAAARRPRRRRARPLGGPGVVRPLPRAARAAQTHRARGRPVLEVSAIAQQAMRRAGRRCCSSGSKAPGSRC